jgi:hypothetical protein
MTDLKVRDFFSEEAVGLLGILVAIEGDVAHVVQRHLTAHKAGAVGARKQGLKILTHLEYRYRQHVRIQIFKSSGYGSRIGFNRAALNQPPPPPHIKVLTYKK